MNHKKITVPKRISDENIELLFDDLNSSPIDIDLQIPIKIAYRGFGNLPKLFLAIFTWMRSKTGSLIIPLDKGNENDLGDFAKNYYGYVVLSTLWKHCDIVNHDGDSLKSSFREFTGTMFKNIEFLSADLPKESVLIPCFDHFSKEKGLPHWFYDFDYAFKSTPSELDNSLHQIIIKLSEMYRSRVGKNIGNSFDAIIKITWELLKNTDEHAKNDFLGEIKLLPNTRGLFMKIQRSSKVNFIEGTNHQGLKRYYETAFESKDDSFILEISVFDSGSGLVKKFLGKNWSNSISLKEEIDTIRKCLIKGQTSIKNNRGKQKGFGLDEVLRLLSSKKGFLKIRTGRSFVYRNLIEYPYKKTEKVEDIILNDWNTDSFHEYSEMKNAEGTLITLAYPLN